MANNVAQSWQAKLWVVGGVAVLLALSVGAILLYGWFFGVLQDVLIDWRLTR